MKPLLHSTNDASRLDCVARRSHIGNMLTPRALPDGRLPGLGATRVAPRAPRPRYPSPSVVGLTAGMDRMHEARPGLVFKGKVVG